MSIVPFNEEKDDTASSLVISPGKVESTLASLFVLRDCQLKHSSIFFSSQECANICFLENFLIQYLVSKFLHFLREKQAFA